MLLLPINITFKFKGIGSGFKEIRVTEERWSATFSIPNSFL